MEYLLSLVFFLESLPTVLGFPYHRGELHRGCRIETGLCVLQQTIGTDSGGR